MKKQILTAILALALPAAALADLSDTKMLTASTNLNLDTGATASGAGGDILWNGSTLTPQVNAKAFSLPGGSGAATFDALDQTTIQAFSMVASPAALPGSSLTTDSIFIVFTNAGHAAKVLVTANSGGSITLQFTTFGAGGGSGGGPSITDVLNNSSLIPAGFPNSGIAQGSLFQVLGSGLAEDGDATLHDSQAAGGLPTTLNGASITVTVGSTTVNVALYYATPTQIDGVLPANTPTGSGTLTVTHNGTPTSFTIQVVTAAPGITTYNNGTAVAQDNSRPTDPYGGLITFTKSAAPGAVIIVWGSGLGATANSDTAYDTSGHQTSVAYTVYIGGVQLPAANVNYKGASVYPGVSVLVLTIPQNVPTGCYVPLAAVARRQHRQQHRDLADPRRRRHVLRSAVRVQRRHALRSRREKHRQDRLRDRESSDFHGRGHSDDH